jgi:hypothetical protein
MSSVEAPGFSPVNNLKIPGALAPEARPECPDPSRFGTNNIQAILSGYVVADQSGYGDRPLLVIVFLA